MIFLSYIYADRLGSDRDHWGLRCMHIIQTSGPGANCKISVPLHVYAYLSEIIILPIDMESNSEASTVKHHMAWRGLLPNCI